MSIEATWLEAEQGVRYWKFGESWTWDELYEILSPQNIAAASRLERVDVIVDFSETKQFPPNLLTNMRTASQFSPVNLGVVAVIGTPFLQALMASFYLLNRSFAGRYIFTKSVTESLALIRQQRGKADAAST